MNASRLAKLLLEAPEDETSPEEIERHIGQVVPRITRAYTIDELLAMTNNGEEYISVNVGVDLWDLIEHDVAWLNDEVSAQITGNEMALEDIGFAPAGVNKTEVILTVVASIERWLADRAEEEQ